VTDGPERSGVGSGKLHNSAGDLRKGYPADLGAMGDKGEEALKKGASLS